MCPCAQARIEGSMYYMSERIKKNCRQERALDAWEQCYMYICIFSAHRGTVTTIRIGVSTLCPCA